MILPATTLFIFGATLGSFACCQARRIKTRDHTPRSHCAHCPYQLKWYDNIPIISWLTLKGKCRRCHHPIGLTEFLTELTLGLTFAIAYLLYPTVTNAPIIPNNLHLYPVIPNAPIGDPHLLFSSLSWLPLAEFITFLILLVPLTILFIYDYHHGELPTKPLTFSIICAIIWLILRQWSVILVSGFSPNTTIDLLAASLILPGLYYALYKFSNERLVGSGDWILCIPLALLLGNLPLAFLTLFLANLLGTLTILPTLIHKTRKKIKTPKKIPFGPFLILAFLIVFLLQTPITTLLML